MISYQLIIDDLISSLANWHYPGFPSSTPLDLIDPEEHLRQVTVTGQVTGRGLALQGLPGTQSCVGVLG